MLGGSGHDGEVGHEREEEKGVNAWRHPGTHGRPWRGQLQAPRTPSALDSKFRSKSRCPAVEGAVVSPPPSPSPVPMHFSGAVPCEGGKSVSP